MTQHAQQVLEAALDLPVADREYIAEQLLASVITPDEQREIDAAWSVEIAARLAAYERGEVQTIPAEEVFARLRAQLAAAKA